ncbi:RNA-binding RNA processing protein rpp1 [Lobulomyces angularis]|nr:RNA-binding RNA processing protein rpp1 [Lobulomyces angularis]
MNTSEAACVYAALILHDDGVDLDATKMKTLIEAAGVDIESIWPTLFAKALDGKNLNDMLMNVGAGGAAPAATGGAPAAGGSAAAAEVKEEVKEEEEDSDEGGFGGLFD